MFRFLVAFALFASPAAADEPVKYCNDDVPYEIIEYEGTFIITQQHGNDTCVRIDADWYECNARPDYRLSFQVSEDGVVLEMRSPNYAEVGRFTECQ